MMVSRNRCHETEGKVLDKRCVRCAGRMKFLKAQHAKRNMIVERTWHLEYTEVS